MNNLKKLACGTAFKTVMQSQHTSHFLPPAFALRASAGRPRYSFGVRGGRPHYGFGVRGGVRRLGAARALDILGEDEALVDQDDSAPLITFIESPLRLSDEAAGRRELLSLAVGKLARAQRAHE